MPLVLCLSLSALSSAVAAGELEVPVSVNVDIDYPSTLAIQAPTEALAATWRQDLLTFKPLTFDFQVTSTDSDEDQYQLELMSNTHRCVDDDETIVEFDVALTLDGTEIVTETPLAGYTFTHTNNDNGWQQFRGHSLTLTFPAIEQYEMEARTCSGDIELFVFLDY
ncbi:hypothetical protein [Shewanella atlantica]|uniref:DUF4402 domain-containing protein n=1 Tax=Shewanella atlantica TaxID=271099 RepID=A0A431VX06_9GAMM|nr:hypothetical protein [Shewanella atlantica]RTR27710.1 hypothetical protein EKG39_20125 [Shewanella atlantica]